MMQTILLIVLFMAGRGQDLFSGAALCAQMGAWMVIQK
jgi:hypothetical protein